MSLPDRLADALTAHTRVVLVVLLLATALVGAGMPMVDDDSSLDQFESDSAEAQALERIEGNFTSDQQENATNVQVISRDDNVLTKESLLSSLEFQQEIRANESINSTLVEDQPITGVENVVAITAIRNDQAADLNQTRAGLEDGLNETVGLQRQYEQLNESSDESDPEYQQQAAELEAQFDAVVENATVGLTENQTAEYEEAVRQARQIESQRYEIRSQTESPEENPEYQQLSDQLEGVYQAGTFGVLEDEYAALESDEQPPIDEQIEALENLDDEEFERTIEETLSGDADDNFAIALMATSYDPGSTQADVRMTSLTQSSDSDGAEAEAMGGVDDRIVESQLQLHDLAESQGHEQEYLVFGSGVITDEIDRSMGDSLAIVGPLALLFVVVALFVAYRDLLDIVLGVVGIAAVLVWTFGFMGWAGIAFNQMFVAVPVLLIGLSIDYAIHVFMRHREQRETRSRSETQADAGTAGDVRGSMTVALAGVGVALVWVTATTVIGFLSNLVSPIGPIREFGIVSSVGIVAALIVFGALIPAAKVEFDEFLEARGIDRRKRAFGTGGGRFSELLTVGSTAARKVPILVLVLVLVLSAGGAYGATQVDTSFEEEDFLAEDPPAWTENLPGGMSPGEYHAKNDLEFVNQHFQREGSQAQLLVEGEVDDPDALAQIDAARDDAAESSVAYELATGEEDVQDPLSTMERVAAQNESFNESFHAADTDDDGVPDENVSALYDQLFETDEEAASQVLSRTDGGDGGDEYDAARLVIGVEGDASAADTTDEMRDIADGIEDGSDGRWTATATGDPIVSHIVEQDLLNTVLESLLITLVAVFAFLAVAYWLTGNSASLGIVTLLPVAFSVSWILGTMYLIGMPFNVLTGMITSLTIGLGVAYSIHISARYSLELERQGNVWSALRTTVTGTGGALLGSAATTVGGFGVLAFAILPALQQFGIITALTITYAFLASVVVLPALLVLWTRYFGPEVSFDPSGASGPTPAASDGGTPASAAHDGSKNDGDGE
ncbi:efflux RND transporter permease subunit [Natrinema salifodinae]|uniref:Predicted exporter protein, RND superfamily n=1 Tax=Natrinema salifodinae TaxID=1202768 RepID=A0A1I0MCE3_9EURY|nr:MMPL family transporter [Natrinema salifodinae]SEV86165.1 Predicted exporter protein, RND superfamily [Natrinema salifodinae]